MGIFQVFLHLQWCWLWVCWGIFPSSQVLYMIYSIYWLTYIESLRHLWNKANLVMLDDCFDMCLYYLWAFCFTGKVMKLGPSKAKEKWINHTSHVISRSSLNIMEWTCHMPAWIGVSITIENQPKRWNEIIDPMLKNALPNVDLVFLEKYLTRAGPSPWVNICITQLTSLEDNPDRTRQNFVDSNNKIGV